MGGNEVGDVDADGCEFGFESVPGGARFASLDGRDGLRPISIGTVGLGPDAG
jgi:hypothetical protein